MADQNDFDLFLSSLKPEVEFVQLIDVHIQIDLHILHDFWQCELANIVLLLNLNYVSISETVNYHMKTAIKNQIPSWTPVSLLVNHFAWW